MQEGFYGVDILRIEHVTGLGPAAARGPDAVASGVERLGRVGVGVDRNCATSLDDSPDRLAGEIEPHRIRVDFEGGAVFGGSLGECGHVDRQARTAVDHAAGRMADDVDRGVFGGPAESVGRRLGVLIQRAVRRGDDEIQFSEQVVVGA